LVTIRTLHLGQAMRTEGPMQALRVIMAAEASLVLTFGRGWFAAVVRIRIRIRARIKIRVRMRVSMGA